MAHHRGESVDRTLGQRKVIEDVLSTFRDQLTTAVTNEDDSALAELSARLIKASAGVDDENLGPKQTSSQREANRAAWKVMIEHIWEEKKAAAIVHIKQVGAEQTAAAKARVDQYFDKRTAEASQLRKETVEIAQIAEESAVQMRQLEKQTAAMMQNTKKEMADAKQVADSLKAGAAARRRRWIASAR